MFKISKRNQVTWHYKASVKIGAVFSALVVLSVLLLFLGHNPLQVYTQMVKGALGSAFRLKETLKIAIPLTLTALAVLLAFKMKFWNIGAEGQIMMGAVCGSYVALFHASLPAPVLLSLMAIAAIVGGGIWALIPGFFKVKYDANETLFTLMMNYIALQIVVFLQFSFWKDPEGFGFAKIAQFSEAAIYPKVLGLHMGWCITLFVIVWVYVLMNHTKLGYEICVVGSSKNTAKYAGIHVDHTILKTIFISGGLAGLVGILQASAVNGTLSVEVGGGYGFTAIIIAWLSGMSTLMIPLTAFFFAILTQGASFIQTAFQIPQAVAEVLQAMILLFALGSEFFTAYKVEWQVGLKKRGVLND